MNQELGPSDLSDGKSIVSLTSPSIGLSRNPRSCRHLELIARIDSISAYNLDPDEQQSRIVDLEIGETGKILAAIDDRGLLRVWQLPSARPIFSFQVDCTSLTDFVNTRPAVSHIQTRFYYTLKRIYNYHEEENIERLVNELANSSEFTDSVFNVLASLVCAQALRVAISLDECYIFVFSGFSVLAFSVSSKALIGECKFSYTDFAIDRASCKAHMLRKDGLFTLDLLECRIIRNDMLMQEPGLQLLPGSIRLDPSNRYLTARVSHVNISLMPFGSFYENEFFLTEHDIGLLLATKGLATLESKFNANDLLGMPREDLELLDSIMNHIDAVGSLEVPMEDLSQLCSRAYLGTSIITWDLITMSEALRSDLPTALPSDYRIAPVYSSILGTHFYLQTQSYNVTRMDAIGASNNIMNCYPPAVNFEIDSIDEFLVILDNNKFAGTDAITAINMNAPSCKVVFDTGCDVFTNMRSSEICRAVVVGCSDGSIRLIDLEVMDESITPVAHANGVRILSSLTDSGLVASTGSDGSILVWSATK
ncbi:MAG: hypothetical protein NTV57_19390 [Cyanobacteria bacterium]|nr:hypothetical protein [Cyanobacteriota bacterium]